MNKLEPFVTVVKRNGQLVKLEFCQSVVRSFVRLPQFSSLRQSGSLQLALSPYKRRGRFLKLYAREITIVQCYADFTESNVY